MLDIELWKKYIKSGKIKILFLCYFVVLCRLKLKKHYFKYDDAINSVFKTASELVENRTCFSWSSRQNALNRFDI